MGRILSDGLIKGEGPAKIARSLTDNIKKMTRTRANVIARTEIIHAHAEGQLDSFQRLNIEEVSAMVEWSTAGDDRVCEQCLSLEGETFTIEEARGQIPLHPNCRCAWMPSDMQRKTVPGKRPSGPIGAPTTKPDIITRIPTKKAPQVIPGTPKPALKTVDRHLLQLTDSLKTGVSQDYSSAFANELAVLSKKFPKVAKKLNSINIASRTGSTLADAGKVTDKLWKINLNKKYFAPTSKWDIARGLKLSVKRNLSAGKGNVSEVLTHEFGHLVNRTLSTKAKTQIESLWWKAQLDDGGKALTKALGKYANTNSSEMFSEAFVQWRAGNTNALVKKIMRLANVKGKPEKFVGKALVEKLKTPIKISKKVVKKVTDTNTAWLKLTGEGKRLAKSDPKHIAFILKHNLKQEEYSALRTWSFGSWRNIRKQDIGALKNLRKSDKLLYKSFYDAASKLPDNKATLYRGLRLTPDDIGALHKLEGKVYILNQSSSFTSDFEIAKVFAKGQVEGPGMKVTKNFVSTIWKVKAKTGKEIDTIGYTGLKENLMLKGTRIRVTGMTWDKVKLRWIIEGVEL